MHELVSKGIDGGKWNSISVSICSLIHYTLIIITTNRISPSEYGVVVLAFSLIEFSYLFINAGLGPALIQKKSISSDEVRSAYTLTMILAFFCYFILLLSSSFLSHFFNDSNLENVLSVLGIIFIFRAFTSIPKALLQKNLQFKDIMLIEIISFFLGYLVFGILLVLNGFGYWAIIYAALIQTLIAGLLSFIKKPHNVIPFIAFKSIKEIVDFGTGLTISRFFNFFGKDGDKLVIGRVFESTFLGIYGMAAKLIMLPVKIIGKLIDHVLFPILSKINEDEKIPIFYKTINYVSMGSILMLLIMSSFLKELVVLFLGESWIEILPPLYIMLVATIFRIIIRICDVFVRAIGAVYRGASQKIIMTILILIFSYVGSYWGIIGVAIGVDIAVFITMIKMINLCTNLLGIEKQIFSFNDIIFVSMVGLSMFLLTFIIKPFLLQSITNLLLVVSILALFNIILVSFILYLSYPSSFRKIYFIIFKNIKVIN